MNCAPQLPGVSARASAVPAAPAAATAELSALDLTLTALRPLLADPGVTELCINRPREIFLETRAGWRCEQASFADFSWCRRLAKLIANVSRQRVDEASPLLSASLPSGERVQLVLPPATSPGCVAITIRRPADVVWSIEELARRGALGAPGSGAAGGAGAVARRWRLSRVPTAGCAGAQEHSGVGRYRIRKDHLDQGPHPRDPCGRAPGDHRGRARAGARRAPQSCAAVLQQGRPGACAGNTEAVARVLPANAARPHPAG